jgi:hypothetical protein
VADEPGPPGDATASGDDQAGWGAPDQRSREPDTTAAEPGTAPPPPPPAPPMAPPPGWESTPPPTTAAGAPVARRRGKTWLVVLISVLAVVVVAAIVGTVLFFDRTYPPYEAARDFIEDVDDGNFTSAFDRLCDADKSDLSQERLRSLFSGILQGSDGLTTNPLSVDRDGDVATVDFTVSFNDDDDTYELPMREEDGEWRPCPGDQLRS